jgi:hypothetical protein
MNKTKIRPIRGLHTPAREDQRDAFPSQELHKLSVIVNFSFRLAVADNR